MRIRRITLTMPPRLKTTANADARQIAETVAEAISAHGEASNRLSIEIPGNGRPARHMGFDLTSATNRALTASRRRS